jgi:hypothetical protein
MIIPFGEYRPDIATLNSSATARARNVLAADGSYLPFPGMSVVSTALPSKPISGFVARTATGSFVIFAATGTKLYRLDTTTFGWTDISKAATTYNATDTEPWTWAQFGSYVVCTNVNDPVQYIDVDSGTEFDDLPGSPPQSRYVAVWGDFLVLANQANEPYKLQWSAINDPEDWTVGSNNSDEQIFPDGGAIVGITSSNNPMIVQENAVRRGVFQPGSPVVFSFDKLKDSFGAKSPYSVTSRDDQVYLWAEDGFYQIGYDGTLNAIGLEKVNRYVLDEIDNGWISRVVAEVDPVNPRVYFGFKSTSQQNDYIDRLLIYDWRLQRWTEAETSVHALLGAATPGYTLEALSTLYPVLEDVPASLDSRIWSGGAPVIASFDTSFKLAFFTGPALAATLETAEIGATDGSMREVQYVHPVVDTDEVTVSVGCRLRRGDAPAYRSAKAPSSNTGLVRSRARSRYHRFRVNIAAGADWTHASGVDVTTVAAGKR